MFDSSCPCVHALLVKIFQIPFRSSFLSGPLAWVIETGNGEGD